MGSTLQSLNIREMSAARRAQFVEWLQLWLPWVRQQQLERAIWNECHDASKICTWGLEELINSAKQKYILTCWDVWHLGGWCDKVSGCYWPEMTVKAVFANFTATSRDICPLLLHPPHPLIEAAPTRATWPPGPIMAPRLGQASLGPTWPPEPQGPTGPPNQKFERDIWLLT